MALGTATLVFGPDGISDASVVVTGQTTIAPTSYLEAWITPAATVDHTADEHWVEEMTIIAGNISAGVGFTIYGNVTNGVTTGSYNISWIWA